MRARSDRRGADAVARLEGAYSLVVLSAGHPDELVGVKVSSPLVVGLGNGETMLASDIPALLGAHPRGPAVDEGQIARSRATACAITTSMARLSRSSRSRSTGT